MYNGHYTVILKNLMENPETRPLLDKAMSTYPIYVQQSIEEGKPVYIPTREELNTKLLNHYKYREIGFETVGRFLEELEISLNEIMPYYNQMMHTVEIMNELPSPFDNVDFVEKYEEERSSESKNSGTSTSKQTTEQEQNNNVTSNEGTSADATRKHSDTPQSELSNLDKYLTDVTIENNSGSSNATETAKTDSKTKFDDASTNSGSSEALEKVTHTFTKVGNQGVNTYAHDMIEFREAILNIEKMIIDDPRITELFMLIY